MKQLRCNQSRCLRTRYLTQVIALTTWICLLSRASLIESQIDASKAPLTLQPKIGLAPNERPSCQLQTAYNRRQALASTADKHLNSETGPLDDQSVNSNQAINGTNRQPVISAPAVLSLQSLSAGNNLASGLGSRKFDSAERLRQLRQLLISNNYDAYLVTPNDEHGSEYVTDYDRRLRFISGFTGSNGYALILLDRAVLFTDGRYQLQADEDLDCNWWLVVSDEPLSDITQWLKAQAAKGIKVATDARLMSLQSFDFLDEQLRKQESEFVLISQDLVDVVWDTNIASGETPARVTASPEPIFVHPLQFNGNVSWQEKVVKLANEMNRLKAKQYVISQLDDIAWLLNLRGNDIPMSPLFKAYVLITRTSSSESQSNSKQVSMTPGEQVLQGLQSPQVLQVPAGQTIRLTLYVDLTKVDKQVRDHLHVDNGTIVASAGQQAGDNLPMTTRIQVDIKDYQVFIMDLRDRLAPATGVRQLQGRLLLNAGANVAIHVLAKSYDDRLVLVESLINKLKAVKTDAEVQGMRLAHWRDSLAICMLLAQLDHDIGQQKQVDKWTEISAAKELEFYRSLLDYNKGQSFDTISAYGSNAAIVHYQPSEPHKFIGNESTFLLDSGGQYLDGTTDITRTTHYGRPTSFQRETYTRVLMGAIDAMSLIFDQSTSRSPYRISDLLARRHLFDIGVDYQHGTGHGIGLFSMVHESPYLIENYATTTNAKRVSTGSKQAAGSAQVISEPIALQANMFTSVEPGYYKANDFGIRLENIVVSQKMSFGTFYSELQGNGLKQDAKVANKRQFLRWEPISVVPFEPRLISRELLSNKQRIWLNSYNLLVRYQMTQQINYYLNKIRQNQLERKPVQVQGTASSSRLYQQLMGVSNSTAGRQEKSVDLVSQGLNNYQRMDGAKLQEKLEQTHKWILSKTEFIPLDIPQRWDAAPPSSGDAAKDQQPSDPGSASSISKENQLMNQHDSNQLMLHYMSSLPFSDREATQVIASYSQMGARADFAAKGKPMDGSERASNCAGFQCDLLLLNSLNHYGRQQRQRNTLTANARGSPDGGLLPTWAEQDLDAEESINLPHKRDTATSAGTLNPSSLLHNLFKLGSGAGSHTGATINMWSLLVVGLLVCVQVAVAAFFCRGGNKPPRVHIAQAAQTESVQLSSTS